MHNTASRKRFNCDLYDQFSVFRQLPISGASKQLEAIHNDATEEVCAALEQHAHLCDVLDGRLQSEQLLGVYVVRIEGLAVQRPAVSVLQRDRAVFAGKAALELDRERGHGGGGVQQQGNVLRGALIGTPCGVFAAVEQERLAVLFDVTIEHRTDAAPGMGIFLYNSLATNTRAHRLILPAFEGVFG